MTINTQSALAEAPSLARRTILGALTLAPALAAAPALASMPATDRRAWNSAFKAHQRAVAEDAAFTPTYERIHDAWNASRPQPDTIDWGEFRFENRDHVLRRMNLDDAWQKFLDGENKWWCGHPEKRKAKMRAALDSVQAYRDADRAHNRDSGMIAADERCEALGDRVYETRAILMAMPAPDLPALRWKLEYLLQNDGVDESTTSWAASYVEQTKADIARLLTGEA